MGRSFVQAGGGGGGETRGSEAWFCLVRLRHWGAIAESREEVWRKEKVALLSVQDRGAVAGGGAAKAGSPKVELFLWGEYDSQDPTALVAPAASVHCLVLVAQCCCCGQEG